LSKAWLAPFGAAPFWATDVSRHNSYTDILASEWSHS
jgi:hypothetical protein